VLQVTGGKERIRFYIERFQPEVPEVDDLDAFIADLHRDKTDVYTRMLSEGGIPLRPGVRRLLEEARNEGLRIAIATTTTPENVSALLRYSISEDAESWFDVISAGDIVPAKKPAPDIYIHALSEMGLQADECLAFEDSHNGILSSMGAGLNTIITVNDYTRGHDFTGAALVIDQMGEPGQPFNVLQGNAYGENFLNVALLRKIHQGGD
jgi:HAD superfamily hydrolase (TIGR01509 family)